MVSICQQLAGSSLCPMPPGRLEELLQSTHQTLHIIIMIIMIILHFGGQ